MTLLSDRGVAPMMDRQGLGMNRAFSAAASARTASWGAAPGCYERCAFGAKHIPGEKEAQRQVRGLGED